ncbi:MAG: cob(I)yrinic acid a,c-diamide adenosyltransferase [Candidatus Omnitrophica bacterium]|nr:cob(I)yrinic acid a,c-diamide adenosyltransferase [Candidatus Omnitrophota bacterium]
MKIYTKKGDNGQTTLIGGTKVPKCDLRIESYGSVDELNSQLGLIDSRLCHRFSQKKVLRQIQNCLFVIGSHLATDKQVSSMKLPEITYNDVQLLEDEIDRMTEKLPEIKSFILPGGTISSSLCHVSRCVCRRTERIVVALSLKNEVAPLFVIYLNRLSDYLFVLGRYCNYVKGVKDIPWKPGID